MAYKLVLLDLDGTLLTSQRTIRDENVRALRRIMDRGVYVGLCTGRPPGSTQRYVDIVRPNAPNVHFNGAMVRDAATGRVHFRQHVTASTALAALAAADAHALHANVYVDDEIWIERRSPTSRVSEEKDGVAHVVVEDLRARLPNVSPPTKVMLITHADRIPALTSSVAAAVGGHASLVNSEPEYLEVLPPNVSKKTAAQALATLLGFTLAEVVAFGDNLNDLDLLENAGLGVAMANSHATVLSRVRTHVGGDNDSDAIARFLDATFP